MAASFGVCRLHMSGRRSLSKCLQTYDLLVRRQFGKNNVAEQAKTLNKTDEFEPKDGLKSFYAVLEERQEQAERSVLISCQAKTNEKKFMKYLSRHGPINKCFFYESYSTYAVVEFANKESITSLYEGTAIPTINHEAMVPFKSRLLSLRSNGPADQSDGQSLPQYQPQTTIPISELIQRLSKEESIDQQMLSLTAMYQLTEENICLRFLVCSLLQDIAAAYFPECLIRPFGSTVNGFGKLGCDLDMFLDLDRISGRNVKPKAGYSLEFQLKRANSERAVTQSILSVIGECVDQFGPGCVGVQKILNARCPLVRFAHQPSGFQCDLTANNRPRRQERHRGERLHVRQRRRQGAAAEQHGDASDTAAGVLRVLRLLRVQPNVYRHQEGEGAEQARAVGAPHPEPVRADPEREQERQRGPAGPRGDPLPGGGLDPPAAGVRRPPRPGSQPRRGARPLGPGRPAAALQPGGPHHRPPEEEDGAGQRQDQEPPGESEKPGSEEEELGGEGG
ncbi:poly(A) RNA polymerase, mitochondrial isoform X2 [Osmerus mordax]|uniref:poly(A) RNA polymerase, mitochondrial isoform X2 n=1 Tax=Osmerus mordax TaxID=8014 RepID=UPI00350F4FFB